MFTVLFFFAGVMINASLQGKASNAIISECAQSYCPDDFKQACPSTWNWLKCVKDKENETCEHSSCYDIVEA